MTEQPEQIEQTNDAWIVPSAGAVIYQVTLESGAIVTSPQGWEPSTMAVGGIGTAIVAADGRVLVPARPMPAGTTEPSEFDRFQDLARDLLTVPKDETKD